MNQWIKYLEQQANQLIINPLALPLDAKTSCQAKAEFADALQKEYRFTLLVGHSPYDVTDWNAAPEIATVPGREFLETAFNIKTRWRFQGLCRWVTRFMPAFWAGKYDQSIPKWPTLQCPARQWGATFVIPARFLEDHAARAFVARQFSDGVGRLAGQILPGEKK